MLRKQKEDAKSNLRMIDFKMETNNEKIASLEKEIDYIQSNPIESDDNDDGDGSLMNKRSGPRVATATKRSKKKKKLERTAASLVDEMEAVFNENSTSIDATNEEVEASMLDTTTIDSTYT